MNKRKSTVEKTSEALESLVGKGDLGGVAAFFEDMPEAQRRTFGPGIVALVRGFRETYWISDPGSGNTADASVRTAASLAVMASANLSELKKLGWRCSPPVWNDDEQALYLAILRNRGPDWIDAWADWLLEQNFRHWRFVRRMVLDSMCAAPKSDVYVLGMIEGIRPHHPG
jgi:hypothetical protein